MNNDLRLCFAEALGTFILVFAGTGAMIVNGLYGGIITHVGVAIAWGLVVMTVVYAFGDVSGAHVNPAVTVGFWLARRFPGRRVAPYIMSQCIGAILASLVLSLLFTNSSGLGMTVPSGPAIQSFVVEIILTFYLMFVILSVATGSKEKGVMAGCAIGAVVGLEALFAGPVSGASMNPARSLAPALASMRLEYLWIYLSAPFIGSSLAVAAFHLVRTARPQEG
ncbi:MAG: MIP/aquaporin family protein [Candidatus Dadabacteria bacterium]